MPNQVVNTAVTMCSFGAAPSMLAVLPANRTMCFKQPAATIMDHIPITNIVPFGMCMSPANPAVAAATTAAMGVLTPMPCVPVTPAPWAPGAVTVMIANQSALDDVSICNCTWGGVIKINFAGQATTQIP